MEITQIAVQVETVNIVENLIRGELAQYMVRNAKIVTKITTLKLCVKVDPLTNMIQADPDPRKRVQEKSPMMVTETNNEIEDIVDQVQSLFYHDVHFNSVNIRMHTKVRV